MISTSSGGSLSSDSHGLTPLCATESVVIAGRTLEATSICHMQVLSAMAGILASV